MSTSLVEPASSQVPESSAARLSAAESPSLSAPEKTQGAGGEERADGRPAAGSSVALSVSAVSVVASSKRSSSKGGSPRYVETLNAASVVFRHVLFESTSPDLSPTRLKRSRPSAAWKSPVDLRKIKVVSFDLDDTLWECDPVITKAELSLQQYFSHKGHDVIINHIKHPQLGNYQKMVYSMHPERSFDVSFVRRRCLQLAAKACHIEDESIIEEAFQHFYHARTFHVSEHLFPGAVEAVARLKRLGLRIGTLSNGNADVLKVPELAPFVEHHVNPQVAGSAKPSPDIFEFLRSRFKDIQPDEILHVGDSYESDVQGALKAGMHACWINCTDAPLHAEDDDKPILNVRHVEDLADMFEAALLDLS